MQSRNSLTLQHLCFISVLEQSALKSKPLISPTLINPFWTVSGTLQHPSAGSHAGSAPVHEVPAALGIALTGGKGQVDRFGQNRFAANLPRPRQLPGV